MATIHSLIGQSHKNFEHLVVDGGSADETIQILKQYQQVYPLRWISEPDRGIADALNKALEMAKGRYILVLHADDRLMQPETLQHVHHLLSHERIDICSFPVLKEIPGGSVKPYRPIRLRWYYHFKTIFPHQGCFVHSRVYRKIGGFRDTFSIALDYDFFYRALRIPCSVRYGTQVVACMGGSGVSSQPWLIKKRLQEECRVQDENEDSAAWRLCQRLFRTIYVPYKVRRVSLR